MHRYTYNVDISEGTYLIQIKIILCAGAPPTVNTAPKNTNYSESKDTTRPLKFRIHLRIVGCNDSEGSSLCCVVYWGSAVFLSCCVCSRCVQCVQSHTTRVSGCYVMPLGNLAVVPERHLDLAYQVLRSGAAALVIPGIEILGVMLIVLECTER